MPGSMAPGPNVPKIQKETTQDCDLRHGACFSKLGPKKPLVEINISAKAREWRIHRCARDSWRKLNYQDLREFGSLGTGDGGAGATGIENCKLY